MLPPLSPGPLQEVYVSGALVGDSTPLCHPDTGSKYFTVNDSAGDVKRALDKRFPKISPVGLQLTVTGYRLIGAAEEQPLQTGLRAQLLRDALPGDAPINAVFIQVTGNEASTTAGT